MSKDTFGLVAAIVATQCAAMAAGACLSASIAFLAPMAVTFAAAWTAGFEPAAKPRARAKAVQQQTGGTIYQFPEARLGKGYDGKEEVG
jgi:hypothetical protein